MKDVKDFKNYCITEDGNIYSTKKKRTVKLKPSINDNGYYQVILTVDFVPINRKVHRLVAQTFLPNPNNYDAVYHIDGNKLNNNVSNLKWVSRRDYNILTNNHRRIRNNGDIWQGPTGYWSTKENGVIRIFTKEEHAERGYVWPYESRNRHKEGDIWKRSVGWWTKKDGVIQRVKVCDYDKHGIMSTGFKHEIGDIWFSRDGYYIRVGNRNVRIPIRDYEKHGLEVTTKHHRPVGSMWQYGSVWYIKKETGIEYIRKSEYKEYGIETDRLGR